ncbi:MAG: hypothetical protein RLZZ115_2759 [Cyanobacteriota bacterium]|jgi:hypothetical protein
MIDSIIDEHFGGYSVVRVDYLEITGDACAAQILHSLEYWTAHRFREIERIEQQNAEAIKNGGQITPVPSEWLYEKIQTFVDAICGTFKRNKVIEALKLLKNKGFIESKPSSIPRDQTLLYRFNIEQVEQSLREAKASKGFSSKRKTKSQSLDINDESLNSNLSQSLDLNRQSLDLNSVQSSDLNSDLYIIHDLNIQVLNSKDPPTPQGESEWGGIPNEAVLVSNEDHGQEGTEDLTPHQSPEQDPPVKNHLPTPEIKHPAAVEFDSRFLPTDTTAENMATWKQIAATGAMRGERSPDPEFLEYYRVLLSKCTHYRGKDCNSNHAKSSLAQKWKSEPLKILADAESWLKAKAKFSGGKSTQTRNIDELSKDERLAILRAKREQKLGA